MAAVVPLVEDEAYYALWASRPSWGYFDHPPMIAWWIAVGEWVFGRTEFGVRVLSVLAFALSGAMTARIAHLLAGPRAAVWAALLVNGTLIFLVLGFVATPDAPSVLFWTMALWAFCELRRSDNRLWWLAVGLAIGLGVLSKFTNLFLAVGFVAWGLGTAEGRRALRYWQLWAGVLIATATLVPLLAWNAANDWVGFELQFGRVGEGELSPLLLVEFALLLVVVVTPLIFWLAATAIARGAAATLLWLHAPFLAYLVWHGLSNHVAPNWLAPAYPALAVLASIAAARASAWLPRAALGLALAIGAVPVVYVLWHDTPVIGGNSPFNQVRGWDDAIAEIRASEAYAEADWVATSFYDLASQLWWYLGEEKPVYAIRQRQRYLFREPFPAELCSRPAVLIQHEGLIFVDTGDPERRETITRRSGDTPLMDMRLDTVSGAEACPSWAGDQADQANEPS
ncbi:ArnT family glycosyltransferase [Pelagibacterium montanilacus]|uniref:ArnT family glycosyltransferase n=1 Tax=Pelagibacterium montanilacus TaxID=2185280 RepID=UPI000F8F7D8F|nr:glycosyltransferase family 39 protein [Pelagibacterium montanilacus]